jgi:hypothetical protein
MLPPMSAAEFTRIDEILNAHEDELIEETLAVLPSFILERRPRVMFENNGLALARWPCSVGRHGWSGWSSVRCRTTS